MQDPLHGSTQRNVQSVAQLTSQIKSTLADSFPDVGVAGEVSDVVRAHSGHIYFTLKDEQAQLRGIVWRATANRLKFDMSDGQEVVCRGEIDVYPPRGSYQLIVRSIVPQGIGSLQQALRRLHQQLESEGLFDPASKKPLPHIPRRIAFVTSPSGAAIRDFLEALARRWPGVDVLVIPARVQGEGAAEEIARGIRVANRLDRPPDVLVVGRGGGSLEDLWCFNEESVVRAIAASRIPVVSAVGHEIDVTLSDLAADVRALTPTDAAQRVVPSVDQVLAGLDTLRQRLAASLRSRLERARNRLDAIAQRPVLRRPLDHVHDLSRRVDELDARATRAISRRLQRLREQLATRAAQLDALSPLAVMARGFSLTTHGEDGRLLRDVADLQIGAQIVTRLARGRVVSRVEELDRDDDSV